MRRNLAMCLEARDLLCDAMGTAPMVPDSMLGPLATIEVPAPGMDPRTLRERLMEEFRIEAMIVPNPGGDTPMIRALPELPPVYKLSPMFSAAQIVEAWLREVERPGLYALVDVRSKALWRVARFAPRLVDLIVRNAR